MPPLEHAPSGEAQREALVRAVKTVFSTEAGKALLEHLERRANIKRNVFRDGVQALALAYWEGRRSLVHELYNLLEEKI